MNLPKLLDRVLDFDLTFDIVRAVLWLAATAMAGMHLWQLDYMACIAYAAFACAVKPKPLELEVHDE